MDILISIKNIKSINEIYRNHNFTLEISNSVMKNIKFNL